MAVRAMSVSATVRYVSDKDPCKTIKQVPVDPADASKGTKSEEAITEGATYFDLSPLDVFLMGNIYDNSNEFSGAQGSSDVNIRTRINQTNIEAVRFGLKGFENFTDASGNAVQFKTTKVVKGGREYAAVTDTVLSMLGLQLIQELADKIKSISDVTADEEKNSAS